MPGLPVDIIFSRGRCCTSGEQSDNRVLLRTEPDTIPTTPGMDTRHYILDTQI